MPGKKLLLPALSLLAIFAATAFLRFEPATQAFPEPAASSRAWKFTFTHAKPRPISFRGDDGLIHWYWYMTYKVVNETGDERLFIPEFTIATDAGDIITAGKNVPAGVFDAVKHDAGVKLLVNPIVATGKLLQGEDNAKESVAIWPVFDHNVDQVSIFVAGLSGETQTIENPLTHDPVTMRNTLMIRYSLPGTRGPVQEQAVVARGEEWVMR